MDQLMKHLETIRFPYGLFIDSAGLSRKIRKTSLNHTRRALVTIRPANPGYTVDEVLYQLTKTKSKAIFTHLSVLSTALSAARKAGIPPHRIAIFQTAQEIIPADQVSLDDLVSFGLSQSQNFAERRWSLGEAKTKIAFLSFSSGTTGRNNRYNLYVRLSDVSYRCTQSEKLRRILQSTCLSLAVGGRNTSLCSHCKCRANGHALQDQRFFVEKQSNESRGYCHGGYVSFCYFTVPSPHHAISSPVLPSVFYFWAFFLKLNFQQTYMDCFSM